MKKKKLEARLTKTKKKLAKTRTELDQMLAIMEKSGMPRATGKPAAGKKPAPKANAASTPRLRKTSKPAK